MFTCEVDIQKDLTSVSLAGELSIYSAAQLFNEHIKTLDYSNDFLVNLQGVEEIDTAGVQILLMLFRRVWHEGKTCEVTGMSASVQNYLNLFNLNEAMPVSGLQLS